MRLVQPRRPQLRKCALQRKPRHPDMLQVTAACAMFYSMASHVEQCSMLASPGLIKTHRWNLVRELFGRLR